MVLITADKDISFLIYLPSISQPIPMKNKTSFVDPIHCPWVGVSIFILFLAMLPVWPFTGNWFGVPAWAAFALLISILTSFFIAYVILQVWQDPDDKGGNNV